MNHNAQYDIAITGGGLAGLSLAILCAKSGWKTILFEKDNYPRHKVCGEYISMESWPHLERLGLALSEMDLPHIKSLQLSDAKGRAYDFQLPLGGFGISRYLLDYLMYQQAVKEGVVVYTNCKVMSIDEKSNHFAIQTESNNYTAAIAVNAYGKRSNLDIKWQRNFVQKKPGALDNWVGVKYHINYDVQKDRIALHNFANGYCGISRIEDGKACLCYLTRATNLRNNGGSIPKMEREVLYQNPALEKIFKRAEFLYDEPMVISQVSFLPKRQTEQNMLMLGDSAGLIAPLCGNGMSMALHASVIAFDQLTQYRQGSITYPQMLLAYTTAWHSAFGSRLATGRLVQRLFAVPGLSTAFYATMHRMPLLSRKVIAMTHGQPF